MARGEAKALEELVRAALREALERFDEPALLRLRGDLQVAHAWFAAHRDPDRAEVAAGALETVTRLHQFTAEIRGFASSRASAERASLFDLGAISALAVENLLTAEKITPMRLFMSGLSEGLMFLASRQYVHGGNAVLDAAYRAHRVAVQDALWSVAMDFREPEGLDGLREARRSIDDVFTRLDDPGVPVATRVVVLHVLYALAAIVRCARVLESMAGRP
jgi:hypothetical protein